MSGPVAKEDAPPEAAAGDGAPGATFELTQSREAMVGRARVRRALPRRARRTVGAWCFADHLGPTVATDGGGIGVGPHPHVGLQTVTWLVAGEVLHRDSLGSEQLIRPGQLNLMTAGRGVAHAEEGTHSRGEVHGLQLWVAQPDATRHGEAAFEHHPELPRFDVPGVDATVLVGDLHGATSPARCDTDHLGVELVVGDDAVLGLRPELEHAVVVLDGTIDVAGHPVAPGALAYLGTGRDELAVGGAGRALLLGGAPVEFPPVMWWNFVARSREEIDGAFTDWQSLDEDRFGAVSSRLERIGAPPPPWWRR